MGSLAMYAYHLETGLTFNNLPVLVADDDFIEHLAEHGFESIELDELYVEYEDWAKENVDE